MYYLPDLSLNFSLSKTPREHSDERSQGKRVDGHSHMAYKLLRPEKAREPSGSRESERERAVTHWRQQLRLGLLGRYLPCMVAERVV